MEFVWTTCLSFALQTFFIYFVFFLKINYGINGVDGLLFFTAKILPAKQDLHQL